MQPVVMMHNVLPVIIIAMHYIVCYGLASVILKDKKSADYAIIFLTIIDLFSMYNRFETTFIYVTHDQTEAMTLGTRIVVLKEGVIQQIDTPKNLYEHPASKFVAGFIGSPQMNFIDALVTEEDGKVVLKMDEHKFVLPEAKAKVVVEKGYMNKTVTMGIRPENIHDPKELIESKNTSEINVKINVYELLGSEVYLYFDLENFNMNARVNADTTARKRDKVKFIMDM